MSDSSVLFVAIGGAAGGLLRYVSSEIVRSLTAWPGYVAVMGVNVVGTWMLGWGVAHLVTGSSSYLLFSVGVCGALTTFSTFSLDNFILSMERKWGQLAFNLFGSIGTAVLSLYVLLGYWLE